MSSTAPASPSTTVHRFEVSPLPAAGDPLGRAVAREAAAIGLRLDDGAVRSTHVYLIAAAPALSHAQLDIVRRELLADPVIETARLGVSAVATGEQIVEVHPLPGVMDPAAQSVALGVRELLGIEAQVSTGWRFDISGVSAEQARLLGERLLANPVIQRVTDAPFHPDRFPRGVSHEGPMPVVALRELGDEALAELSRRAHLFLSPAEMRAVQQHYRAAGRDPRLIELETLAQTWSEHCVHKTLKSTVVYREHPEAGRRIDWAGRPGHTVLPDGSVRIDNLLKSTIAAATFKLIEQGVDWTLSVFKDNSGVIAFDDDWGVCIKVETHNRPSAIEPYGGAATGIGGCIRDVIGTGLGAKPIASTDVFCVAHAPRWADGPAQTSPASPHPLLDLAAPSQPRPVPAGTLHPRRVLTQVVAGVRDYGNRMGIPTVSGAVVFDDRYIGNPLVFCGCVGLIPRGLVRGKVREGDRVIALGGRTGRDGVHGATFSSAELEQSAADEFAHAVQIGNAVTEKQVLDAVLRARDEGPGGAPLFHAMTDCGAGGFSSAVGEMGASLGAEIELDRAPLKYPGLSPTEVWISEAQERMVLAVPPENVPALERICRQEGVEMADLGRFGTPGAELVLNFAGREVGRLSMALLHEGIPMPTREAQWPPAPEPAPRPAASAAPARRPHMKDMLLALLADPNIASKHWIVRQYDHEVQGNTVVKPLVGPRGRGPGDASVVQPVAGSPRGVAVGCGLSIMPGDPALGGDPYEAALLGVDEAVRNLVCAGADPARTAILDNFCWPSCDRPANMGALVRACEGCYDAAMAYRTPFVSGKDSLNNQLRTTDPRTGQPLLIEIPYTLLITGLGIVHDVSRCVTSDAKAGGPAGTVLVLVGRTQGLLGGSHFQRALAATLGAMGMADRAAVPRVDLAQGPRAASAVAALIAAGEVRSAHDCSDGGLLVAVAEMLIGGSAPGAPIGAELDLAAVHADALVAAFDESPSRYVLEVAPDRLEAALGHFARAGVPAAPIGRLNTSGVLTAPAAALSAIVGDLAATWTRPLDW